MKRGQRQEPRFSLGLFKTLPQTVILLRRNQELIDVRTGLSLIKCEIASTTNDSPSAIRCNSPKVNDGGGRPDQIRGEGRACERRRRCGQDVLIHIVQLIGTLTRINGCEGDG